MSPTRWLSLATLVIAASFGSVCAQRRDRLPPPRDPQFYAPRNKLEEFEARWYAILFKGQTWTGVLRAPTGAARVEVIEIRDTHDVSSVSLVVITMSFAEFDGAPAEIRVVF